jgi:hypothetical protein
MKTVFKFLSLLFFISVLGSPVMHGQEPLHANPNQEEVTLPLLSNPHLKQLILERNQLYAYSKSSGPDTIELPFFDDFSRDLGWPQGNLWADSSVYVNFGFGINPPSVGCATFDGLDKYGDAYNSTNVGASGLCDMLTSKPIDLLDDDNSIPYVTNDSLFLVFYYQRKGRGDKPETNDSLSLQFFNVNTQTWQYAWSASGNASGDTEFTKVRISINNPAYRQKGFKFRFRSYGSLNGMLDIWNIDYVSLNRFLPPDYDLVRDYAFSNEGFSLFNSYSAIPWTHYDALSSSQQNALLRSSAVLSVRNNNDGAPFPLSVSGVVRDRNGVQSQLFGGGGTNSIVVPLNSSVTPPSSFSASSYFNDAAAFDQTYFDVVYSLGQTSGGVPDDFSVNDTLYQRQHFYDYYSYDDGSAELAYGINGVGAKLAYRFDLLASDTLRAINMYFVQSGASVASQQFRLAVWAGNSNGPQGNPVYEKFNQTPVYVDSVNKYKTYSVDPLYLTSGTWYFGFIQNNAVLLNLGLDVNTPSDPSRKYFNTSGVWTQSQLPGMWMIRPVFSQESLYTTIQESLDPGAISVYPNPATDRLNITYPDNLTDFQGLEVFDATGRTLYYSDQPLPSIEISHLSQGVYSIVIRNRETARQHHSRFVVGPN